MKALIQRVSEASVEVDGDIVGQINQGLLVLLGVDTDDDESTADKLAERVTKYRIFSDTEGRMNLSLRDIEGDILVVSQFTLSADTKKGLRPSFTKAADPLDAERLYRYFVDRCGNSIKRVETGQFGADMQVKLINDGPVTFLIEV